MRVHRPFFIFVLQVNDYLTIDHGTGALRTKKAFDFESTGQIEFSVSAYDSGSPVLKSLQAAQVFIEVINNNDAAPKFTQEVYEATLLLPTYEGVAVGFVQALDDDSLVKYQLADETEKRFTIDSIGRISVGSNFVSLSPGMTIDLEIVATDGVHQRKTTQKINMKAIEESGLSFSQSEFDVGVMENLNVSQMILLLHAYGADLGDNVHYKLLNPNPWFELGASTGLLKTTSTPLDREEAANRILIVQAEDSKGRVARAVVNVTISDENDCVPQFIGLPYHGVIRFGAKTVQNATKVNAIDRDSGANGIVRYELKNSHDGKFWIDSEGYIGISEEIPSDWIGKELGKALVLNLNIILYF